MEKNSKTSRHFLLSVFFFSPRGERGEIFWENSAGRVPVVPEALYSLSTHAAHTWAPAGRCGLSRRHVCFSVVKRAAGRQTGLNQPPPLSVSPLLPLSLPLPILSSGTIRLLPSSFALHGRTVCTARSVSQSDRLTNCFLFERTN